MSKRLILILALAFVVGIALTAYAEVQNVKVSGDLTIRGMYRKNYSTTNKGGARSVTLGGTTEESRDNIMSTTRLRVDADLTDNVSATVRLLNERDWNDTTGTAGDTADDINLDLAYATMKEFLYSPLTVKLGRQEIRLGDGLVIGDGARGNPDALIASDYAARKAFDAALAVLDYDPLTVYLAYAKLAESAATVTDDFEAYIFDGIYKLGRANAVLDGYYVLGHYSSPRTTSGLTGTSTNPTDINVLGLRVTADPIKNLSVEGELAHEFGTYLKTATTVRKISAMAATLGAKYALQMKYSPVIGAKYGFRSGKDADAATTATGKYRGWIALYEDQVNGEILDPNTNTHFINLSAKAKPKEDITLAADYYRYYWDELPPTVAGSTQYNRNRGDGLDLNLTYDYTEDVQFGLLNAYFFPGSSYEHTDDRTAVEFVGSMRVTF